ncbi:hypothetical protein HYV86_02250 [Candidatus Woesearchaeota archaeon]|nr:hypothetical protein [Candidatus Woesearchaeota archaeon]
MVHLKSQHLLFRLASSFYLERESFSKQEILAKINEIKYLSEQKKVPRFQLQKEIHHLQHKLNVVFELEHKLAAQRRHESMRINALKKEIASLRQRLALAQDPEFCSKVEKVAHTIGTLMAQRETKAMVDVASQDASREQKIAALEEKLAKLETLVEIQRRLDPAKAALLDQRIHDIKERLGHSLPTSSPSQNPVPIDRNQEEEKETVPNVISSVTVENSSTQTEDTANKPRHVILFKMPPQQQQKFDSADIDSEKELPLPPPPKRRN